MRHYETELLILYSRGELTGRTRLRAPPPGLVGGRTSSSGSTDGGRRSSEESESRHSSSACLRTSNEAPFSSCKRTEPASDADRCEFTDYCNSRRRSSHKESVESVHSIPERALKEKCDQMIKPNLHYVPQIPKVSLSGRVVPSVSLSVSNEPNFDSTCL